MKEPLFTKENFKFFIVELIKLGSNKKSYFSLKRILVIHGWVIAQWGLIMWALHNWNTTDYVGIIAWSSVNLGSNFAFTSLIQKEKREIRTEDGATT
jgi:hypothetical protein